jgi:hypothetical protein
MNCSWGDGGIDAGLSFPLNITPAFANSSYRIFNALHNYTVAGIYNQTCTMYNMVSNQTLSHNVS